MTVCVAALCSDPGGPVVIGAADRMVTAESTEFETRTPKIWPFSSSIVALVAGDTEFQTELLTRVQRSVKAAVDKAPEVWWKVEDVANLYREEYFKARSLRAEEVYLAPLGLRVDNFIAHQKSMDRYLVEDLTRKMWDFEMPGTETIFTGIDDSGAHLFMWLGEELRNRNVVSFASIGAGHLHADSEMMRAAHTWASDSADTMVLVHSAKKRAEAAPGVGSLTDMFVIGPALGSLFHLNAQPEAMEFIKELDRQYGRRVKRERSAADKAGKAFKEYMRTKAPGASPQGKKSTSPQGPSRQKARKQSCSARALPASPRRHPGRLLTLLPSHAGHPRLAALQPSQPPKLDGGRVLLRPLIWLPLAKSELEDGVGAGVGFPGKLPSRTTPGGGGPPDPEV